MFDLIPLNTSTEDLIRECRCSPDPLVAALCARLAEALDEIGELESELREKDAEPDGAECSECDRKDLALDAAEDRIAALEGQLAHELERHDEFYDENQSLRAQIRKLENRKAGAA